MLTITLALPLAAGCQPDSKSIGDTLTVGETGAQTTGEPTSGDATDGATSTSGGTSSTGPGTSGTSETADETGTTAATGTGGTTDEQGGTGGSTDSGATDSDTGTSAASGSETGTTGEQPFACGQMTCDAQLEYCSVFIPGVQGAEKQFSCEQLPQACQECGCLPEGDLGRACNCEQDVGFTVTCAGA